MCKPAEQECISISRNMYVYSYVSLEYIELTWT